MRKSAPRLTKAIWTEAAVAKEHSAKVAKDSFEGRVEASLRLEMLRQLLSRARTFQHFVTVVVSMERNKHGKGIKG